MTVSRSVCMAAVVRLLTMQLHSYLYKSYSWDLIICLHTMGSADAINCIGQMLVRSCLVYSAEQLAWLALAGPPGLAPLPRRGEIVFQDGYRSRQYCLRECTNICALKGTRPG
jgi:hypothetical protein